ncbi:hypothetical protein PZ937_21925 [Vibrio alginolyticus]|nr:hypothetical protein [Vibrio alginolyticus]
MKKVRQIVRVLKAFQLHNDIPFSVVDLTNLPANLKDALDEFMIGQTVPHDTYIYAHDCELCQRLVKSGQIKIE